MTNPQPLLLRNSNRSVVCTLASWLLLLLNASPAIGGDEFVTATDFDLDLLDEGRGRLVVGPSMPNELIQFGSNNVGRFDFNGDGLSDFAIGSFGWIDVYIGAQPLPVESGTEPTTRVEPEYTFRLSMRTLDDPPLATGWFWDVSSGDFNADGFDDFAFHVFSGPPHGLFVLHVKILYGGREPYTGDLWFSDLPTEEIRCPVGSSAIDVSGGGDVNADGFDDLAIVCTSGEGNGPETDMYLLYGPLAGGTDTVHLDYVANTQRSLIKLPRAQFAGSELTRFVSLRGDSNGDAIADVHIRLHGQTTDGSFLVTVFGDEHLEEHYSIDCGEQESPAGDDCGLQPNTGFVIASSLPIHDFSAGGDVNGDGLDDVFLAEDVRGVAVFGSTDSLPPVIYSDALDGTQGFQFVDTMGRLSRIATADVNGDRIADVLATTDKVRVLFGHSGNWPTSIDLSAADGFTGFSVLHSGVPQSHYSSTRVTPIGDMNADGISDILISPLQVSGLGTPFGEAHVLFGFGLDGEECEDPLNGTLGLSLRRTTQTGRLDTDLCPDPGPEMCINDIDCDDVLDGLDNCPTVTNPEQTDVNQNGIGDECDQALADTNGDGWVDQSDVDFLVEHGVDLDGNGWSNFVDELLIRQKTGYPQPPIDR